MRKIVVSLVLCTAIALAASAASAAVRVDATYASSTANNGQLVQAGFNTREVGAYRDRLDAAWSKGLRGIVWLGGYSNSTCAFYKSDAWIRSHVVAIANHPAVVAYWIDDEPKSAECPKAPAQMKARSNLVKSLDPGTDTLLVHYREEEFDDFVGSADILGVVSYPCSHKYGCRFSKIGEKVKIARAGGWKRLWGLPQTFGDEYYRIPTPSELRTILSSWAASGVEGTFAYTWDTEASSASVNPALWPVLASG